MSKNAAAASAATASAVSGSGNGTFSAAALTGVTSVTAPAATALTLAGGSTSGQILFNSPSATERARLTSTGNLLIGTTTDAASLAGGLVINGSGAGATSSSTITGALRVTGGVGVSGAVNVGGAVTATGTAADQIFVVRTTASGSNYNSIKFQGSNGGEVSRINQNYEGTTYGNQMFIGLGSANTVALRVANDLADAQATVYMPQGRMIVGSATFPNPILTINGTAGSDRALKWQSAGTDKWQLYTKTTTESFNIYSSGGTNADVLSIAHATGAATFAGIIKPQQATTAGAPAYVKGAIYFDTTLNKLRVGGATAWETITSV